MASAEVESINSSQNDTSLTQVLTQADYLEIKPIIDYLEENESITTKTAMKLLGKSKSTVLRYISKLMDANVIAAEGNTDNLRYIRVR